LRGETVTPYEITERNAFREENKSQVCGDANHNRLHDKKGLEKKKRGENPPENRKHNEKIAIREKCGEIIRPQRDDSQQSKGLRREDVYVCVGGKQP